MRNTVTPAGLVGVVVLVGAVVFGALLAAFEVVRPGYARLIVGSYMAAWVLAITIVLFVAVIVQASVRKRHGVFSHLKQTSTTELTGGDARAEG